MSVTHHEPLTLEDLKGVEAFRTVADVLYILRDSEELKVLQWLGSKRPGDFVFVDSVNNALFVVAALEVLQMVNIQADRLPQWFAPAGLNRRPS